MTAKEIISMGLKDFGDILKEGWPPKVELGKNVCHFTWLNMSDVTIIEMITLKTRKTHYETVRRTIHLVAVLRLYPG